MGLKDLARAIVAHDGLVPLWRRLAGNLVSVQMLHRFTDAELGARGASIPELRARLAFLRRHRFHIASLGELLAPEPSVPLRKGPSVVFTVDDGYADFSRVAAPVFAEFDCPVTVFLVTGAVDGTCWFWWDRVEFAIESTKRTSVELELNGRTRTWRWETTPERSAAIASLTEWLKLMPNEQKELALVSLVARLDVELPVSPPPRYSAMTWSDVRRCATLGVAFGPHTVTHPILPNVSDAQAKSEVLESWHRVRSQCGAVVPVFAYPNGLYTNRDVSFVAESDLAAALTTAPRGTSRAAFHAADAESRTTIPRFAYTDDRAQFVQTVTVLERLKTAVRDLRSGSSSTAGW